TFKVGTRRTIFSFYLFIVMYLVGLALLDRLPFFHPVIGYETDSAGKLARDPATQRLIPILAQTSWFTGLHPFLALRSIFFDKAYMPPELGTLPPELQSWPIGWYLSSPSSFYITFMFVFSLLLVTPSIVLLRRMAQTTFSFRHWILAKLRIGS